MNNTEPPLRKKFLSQSLSLQTNTDTRPNPVELWLQKSRQADDPQDALEYAQRAVDLRPHDPRVLEGLQQSVLERLRQDAFVAFVAETEQTYVITFRNSRPIVVPKTRTPPEVFPPEARTAGERVFGRVGWIVLGLIPVGVGALFLSPLVMRQAAEVLLRPHESARERRLAWLTLFLASGLGLLGAFFTLLLALHWIY